MLNNLRCRKLIPSIICLLAFEFLVASASVFVNHTIQLSSPRIAFGYIEVDNKIYFAGGFGKHDSVESNVIDVLDLTNNTMSQLTLGGARGMITPVVIEPRIYFIGGFAYTNVPYILDPGTYGLTTSSFTSGPTIRRPTKLALYGTTLTVIGRYSVDFMNVQSGVWNTNPKLTKEMNKLRGTTTFAHQNNVFVLGGYNLKTNEWSSSVWMIDAPSSDPIEFPNQAPEKPVISSTFDAHNQVAVFVYSDTVMVYSISDQLWINRDISAFVSSVSYAESTIVFLSDGYWTLDWTSTSNTWTPVSELTLAFAISDQFVYTSRDPTSGWNVAINTGPIPDVEYQTLLPSLEGETIQLSVQLNSTVIGFVTSRGNVFKYDASTRQFAQFSLDQKTPQYLFRLNNSTMCMVAGSTSPYTVYTMDTDAYVVNQKDVDFLPMALVGTNLISIYSKKMISILTWVVTDMTGTQMPANSLWAQEGSNFLAMVTYPVDKLPNLYRTYLRTDVYNYVQGVWETQLNINSALGRSGFIQASVFNDTLVLPIDGKAFLYNRQSGWSQTEIANFKAPSQNFPTFAPTPLIDGSAYFPVVGTGMNVVTWPLNVTSLIFESDVAYARYIVPYESKMLFLATTTTPTTDNKAYTKIITYDIAKAHFDQTIIPTVSDLSLVMYDGFLLAFTPTATKVDYFYPDNNLWGEEPFDNTFMPAVLRAMPTDNSSTLLMVAGGFHREMFYYSDNVQFMVLNLTVPVAPTPVAEPEITPAAVLQPEATPDDSQTVIIIAVVVPVGAVVIAGVLLAVLLTRRNKNKKKVTTTSELEVRYGQWFTPFSEIQFGRQLGQGANGQVFEGTWKNTRVALKVSSTQANASVISELEVMINMRPHPNVIQLFGFTVHPETNSVVLIIEFCDGGSLDGVLYDSNTQLTTQQKLAWILGAAKGLNHLHSNNVVHRDVAARNILLHQNEPKLTDFGMSRFVEEDQKGTTRSELGPIRWMSPESLKHKQYSNKSDVWSFGILMFEIVVQEEPHNSVDPINVARQIRDQGLVPTIPPSCPQNITSMMKECWHIDPEKRPTMGHLVDEIERL